VAAKKKKKKKNSFKWFLISINGEKLGWSATPEHKEQVK